MPRLLRWVAGIYLCYLLISLLLVLPALNIGAPLLSERFLKRELRAELILFNPFTLAIEARKLSLAEYQQPDTVFAGFRRLEVNLSASSLIQQGWVLDTVELEAFHAHLRRTGSDTSNIDDLFADEEEVASESSEIPAITIKRLSLHSKRLTVTDENRAPVYQTHWDNLSINVSDLSTIREAGQPYRLNVTAEAGGRLEWEGDVSIPGGFSEGKFALNNVQLRTGWRFAEPWLGFEVASGALGLSGQYRVEWNDIVSWSLSEAALTVENVDVSPKDAASLPDTYARLARLTVGDIAADSASQTIAIDQVSTEGINIAGFSEGNRVSLVDMFATSFPESDTVPDDNASESAGEPWTLSLGRVNSTGGQIDWGSEFTEPATTRVRGITFFGSRFSWPAQSPSDLALSLDVNDRASLEVNGQLDLSSGDGDFTYTLNDLLMEWFSPNIPEALNVDISGGAISTTGTARLKAFAPVTAVLDGEIGTVQVVIHEDTDAISGWESLRWKNLSVDIPGQQINADTLFIDRYTGRLHIREDGTINSQRLLQEQAPPEDEQQPEQGDSGEPWLVSIPSILISESALDFKDESLPLDFQTLIGELNGDVTGFSTSANSELTVDLKGAVDGYAPVILAGTAQPFRELPALDMGLSFEGIDLALLTPYSGTYAGYAIERGLLNVDLKYRLEDNRMQGDNHVVVDQLKLGERIDSDRAVDLPIGLALALLTDANGVIDLAVPVSGSLDDPEFSLGSVIGKAFVNLITKAVTAPFNLLAGLVGSEEDLERVTYPAGRAELDERGQTKLTQLAQALAQRPELTLVIMGRFNPQVDRSRLQKQALDQQLLNEGLSAEDIAKRSEAWVSAVEKRYRALGLAPPEEPSLSQKADAVLTDIAVTDADLQALAVARATEAKRYLVNEAGVDADRAVIDSVDPDDEANRISGIEFSIDT